MSPFRDASPALARAVLFCIAIVLLWQSRPLPFKTQTLRAALPTRRLWQILALFRRVLAWPVGKLDVALWPSAPLANHSHTRLVGRLGGRPLVAHQATTQVETHRWPPFRPQYLSASRRRKQGHRFRLWTSLRKDPK